MTLIERLVRCYSPSGCEEEAAEVLATELEARGFQAHLDEIGNVVGTVGRGELRVYLVGHVDTVPGEIPVRLVDGKLFGRGSVDAKGSLAAFVEAAGSLKGSEGLRLTVIGCVGEEADSRGARHLLRTHQAPDFAVVGEPSGWDAVTLAYKGALSLFYRLKMPRSHRGAAHPTPAEEAVAFYQALLEACGVSRAAFCELALKLVAFNTGCSGSFEFAQVEVDARTPPGFDVEAFQGTVERLRGVARIDWGPFTPAVRANKKTPLVRSFLGAIRDLGGTPRFKRKTGTSDMNLLAAWGVPMLAYGPGDSRLDHTPSEHLSLDEYERAIAVLRDALGRLKRAADKRGPG